MTDIERLRENVINAAREARDAYKSWGEHTDTKLNKAETKLIAEVNALDAALTPDPWELLEEALRVGILDTKPSRNDDEESTETRERLKAALKWREEQA